MELIIPPELREASRRSTSLLYLVFCGACNQIIWGFHKRAYQCQLCDLFIHAKCRNNENFFAIWFLSRQTCLR
ncbi:unnamed protein product [Rotaria magnacalcarata]